MYHDESTARVTRESEFRIERDARVNRRADASNLAKTAADTSSEKPGERSGWRDHIQAALGLLLISAIALGGFEVFARLCANTEMIR
jgi:hypothetical protein